MSVLGPGPVTPGPWAAQAAGSLRSGATTDEEKAVSAQGKGAADRAARTERALGDLSEADLSTDRDADGRMPYDEPPDETAPQSPVPSDTGSAHGSPPSRAPDATGTRGTRLDLEA